MHVDIYKLTLFQLYILNCIYGSYLALLYYRERKEY